MTIINKLWLVVLALFLCSCNGKEELTQSMLEHDSFSILLYIDEEYKDEFKTLRVTLPDYNGNPETKIIYPSEYDNRYEDIVAVQGIIPRIHDAADIKTDAATGLSYRGGVGEARIKLDTNKRSLLLTVKISLRMYINVQTPEFKVLSIRCGNRTIDMEDHYISIGPCVKVSQIID